MFPMHVCQHWQIEWLGSREGVCNDCGKLGHWFDGMVLWQRRGSAQRRGGGQERGCGQERGSGEGSGSGWSPPDADDFRTEPVSTDTSPGLLDAGSLVGGGCRS